MTPVLVTPPSGNVVDLATLKLWCQVDHDFEDTVITSLGIAATAYLDGWGGILGRAILEQQWAVTYDAAGTYILPLPDLTEVVVDYGDGDEALATVATPRGAQVELTAAGTVTMTCAMDARTLEMAKIVICMMVAHWFEHRRAAGPDAQEVPMQAGALVQSLRKRWVP